MSGAAATPFSHPAPGTRPRVSRLPAPAQDPALPGLVVALFRPRPWLSLPSHCGAPRLPHLSILGRALQVLIHGWTDTTALLDQGSVGPWHDRVATRFYHWSQASSAGSGLVLASSCRPRLAQAPPQYTCKEGSRTHRTTCSHPLPGHHSSFTPCTLNGPGLPAATTRSTDTAPPCQTAGSPPAGSPPQRSQRSPGRTARTGLAVSRPCSTEHDRLGALPHAACPCSNLTLATTQT